MRSAPRVWLAALAAMAVSAAPARGQNGERAAAMCGPAPPAVEATPAIAAAEICAAVAALAADSMEGREAGTAAAERAAGWLADRFEALGLEPADGGWLQDFTFAAAARRDPHHVAGPGDSLLASANVVGLVRGRDPELRDEAVVIGAHYDHLGWGGAGSLAAGERAIHNGADDNASGTAGLLELAGWFAAHPARRTLVFVAFGAEELGAIGSQHYVRSPAWLLERTVAMINLDMIGRLGDRLTVQGTGSSPAWDGILDRIGSEPGRPELARVPDGLGPSDHASFYVGRIPVLFFFTGAHADYHRPTDDVDRIDAAGAVRVLDAAAAAIAEVADAEERIAFSEAPVTQPRAAAFKVALGVVPDYGFAGAGVRLSAVRPGGPAETAGLQADDVLVELAGRPISDVYAYTAALAELAANVPVEAVVERGERRVRLTVVPEPR